ncbi:Autophagy-related protein 10 [Ophiocordyceps sinensis CO18]|uniref:Autophagy-related protein 10 n=1 Tax=Ophiocordyceps sinensis (strain Co18 / CGMCC 3.14243) TaxID=911162 RepID=T5A5B4_OPHSC|nr:Autophagy-related protein 10 [Ophiocordyceps sinensis CO18]
MDNSINDFPYLDRQEFSEACHHLDRQYCHATLGPLRRRWRLRLCNALDTVFSVDGGYTTYIQVTRPLEPRGGHDSLSLDMGRISISGQGHQDAMVEADQDMMDAEELDSAAIIKRMPGRDAEHVTYEIHLHPTYQVPCLWFTLHNLPADEPAFSIDTVFRRLVPDEYKDGLRGRGAIGGISADVSLSFLPDEPTG